MKCSASKPVAWNAADYAANSVVQQKWARELILKLRLRGNERVLDVGCGDGKVTAEIARAVPNGFVVGIDASRQMIGFAQRKFPRAEFPNLKFQILDAQQIESVGRCAPCAPARGGQRTARPAFDVIFSNATLHWIGDHQAFLRGAASVLRSGGRLVISCGGKGNAHDVFLALRPEMRLKRWWKYFRGMPKPYFFYARQDYERWLPRFGFKTQHVQLVPKDAVYPGPGGFAAWLRTTWLPYTQRVPENLREEFISAVAGRYVAKHPLDAEGNVPVRMVRLEIDAIRI